MFVGHAALGFAAKARWPRLPLALLLAATFGLDLLWPALVLCGVERVRIDPGHTAFTPLAFDAYPWSHSLVLSLAWGVLAGALVLWRRADLGGAAVVGGLVVSHWVLDLVSHRPDLPLWPGAAAPLWGLGLWRSVPATLIVEGGLFAAGVAAYVGSTRPRDRSGTWSLVTLLAFLAVTWVSGPFGPPPPSATAVASVGLLFAVVVLPWSRWIDGHRTRRGADAKRGQ